MGEWRVDVLMYKYINHLTKEEIKNALSRSLIHRHLEINTHVFELIPNAKNEYYRYYIIIGFIISNPDYYILHEITKQQFDNRKLIHELMV